MPIGGVVVNRVPSDPFLPAERLALESFIENVPLHGMDRFRAIPKAQASLERLRAATEVPCAVLPELAASGHDLVVRLSSLLAEAHFEGSAA